MSTHSKYLYAVVYPNEALIASQLPPERFGRYYSVGSARYYSGKMLFLEIDLEFRHPYFKIDQALEQTVEHPDGTPKHTKFISSYRVLEHLPNDCVRALWAVTTNGVSLRLERRPFLPVADPGRVRVIQELNPVEMLICSTMDQQAFGRYITDPDHSKGAPRLLFTQVELDVDHFLAEWAANPFIPAPLPGVHPQKLAEALKVLKAEPAPRTKSIGIQSVFEKIHYNHIRHGFWLAAGEQLDFFALPDEQELRERHHRWWKSY